MHDLFSAAALDATLRALDAQPDPNLFPTLATAYQGPGRHYHTSQHVAECLRQFRSVAHLAEHPAEVEIALWFHDAVYDPRAGDNEERSAEWAHGALTSAGADTTVVTRVTGMVLATKSHRPDNGDAALLVDVDLGILGAPPAQFARYDAAIRREYAHVPDDAYRDGRRRILQGFLARKAIYHSPTLRERLEAQARANLSARLAGLVD